MYTLYIYGKINHNRRLTVRDDRGQIRYLIDGASNRNDNLITLSDLNGDVILSAKQIMFTPLPLFHLMKDDQKIGSVRRHPDLFGIRESYFTVHPHDWVIAGDFSDVNFVIHHNHQLIMKCKKIFIDEYDLFQLEIKNEKDGPLTSLLAVVLDYYSHIRTDVEEEQNIHESGYNLGLFNNIKLSHTLQKTNAYKTKTR